MTNNNIRKNTKDYNITENIKTAPIIFNNWHGSVNDSPLAAVVNALRSSSIPENLRFSSPTRWREPLLSARSSTLCTVLFTVRSTPTHTHFSSHKYNHCVLAQLSVLVCRPFIYTITLCTSIIFPFNASTSQEESVL